MKLTTLHVEAFRAIERCTLQFGPGLNILHGPNDLGKSTLARAVEAVLLLPYSSADGVKEHAPWFGDHVPQVELCFLGDDQRHYRVKKRFEGQKSSATLEWSNDGQQWVREKQGKEVDPRLRELLAWGIPSNPKKMRGLPSSFLSIALLAEQTAVDAILQKSLSDDDDESGRLKLSAALSALAEDPELRAALVRAQSEVDRFYTSQGRPRRGAGSPFEQASERITSRQRDLETARQSFEAFRQAEQALEALRVECDRIAEEVSVAETRRQSLSVQRSQTQAREAAQGVVDRARDHVNQLEAQQRQIAERREALAAQTAAIEATSETLEALAAQLRAREEALQQAETELREQTGDRAAQRALARAEQEKQQLEQRAALDATQATYALAGQALEAAAKLAAQAGTIAAHADARAARAKAHQAQEDERRALAGARNALTRLVAHAEFIDRRAAVAQAAEAVAAKSSAAQRAAELHRSAEAFRAEAESRGIPSVKQVDALARLERERGEAQARLGGGLELHLRARRPVTVRHRVDAGPAEETTVHESFRLEAERSATIAVADWLDFEVVAGDAAVRQAAADLEQRWLREAAPILERSGCQDTDALRAARAAVDALIRESDDARAEAERCAAAAADLDAARVRLSTAEAQLGPDPGDEAASSEYAELTGPWPAAVEARRRALDARQAQLDTAAERGRADELAQVSAEQTLAIERAGLETRLTAAHQALGTDLEAARRDAKAAVDAHTAALDTIARTLATLAREADAEVGAAEAAVQAARNAVKSSAEAWQNEARAQAERRSARDSAAGQLNMLEAQFAAADLPGARQALAEAEAALRALPTPASPASEADLRQAEAACEALRQELRTLEQRRLTQQGRFEGGVGMTPPSTVSELEQALAHEQSVAADLELDAKAWVLLRDTLKATEADSSAHLGNVLARDVSEHLRALSDDRYAELILGPRLENAAVKCAGAVRAPAALSVGTREQLATLLRLAIAAHLKSPIILDDQLVQSDPERLDWFRQALRRAAEQTQIIVLTCRRTDYETEPSSARIIDLSDHLTRFDVPRPGGRASRAPSRPSRTP